MSRKERALRIATTVLFVLAGLWMLNHAVFSFWVSGGPPNDYPEIWYQQGIIFWWRAVVLITCGVLCQFTFTKLKKSWLAKLAIAMVLVGLAYSHAREFILVDDCLDSGGSWSKEYFRCQNA